MESAFACADFNGDSYPDFFTVVYSNSLARGFYLENDGTGRFTDLTGSRFPPGGADGIPRAWNPIAVDVDDDGDLDLAISNSIYQGVMINHFRQIRISSPPRFGNSLQVDMYSGPGVGLTGMAALAVAFGVAAAPAHLPGFDGLVQVDSVGLEILSIAPLSATGVQGTTIPVPPMSPAFTLPVWFQGAVLQSNGMAGLTNALPELVLR